MGQSDARRLVLLLNAIGGRERILAVKTYVRDAIHRRRAKDGADLEQARVLTFRAAGGRLRIETHVMSADRTFAPSAPDVIVLPSGVPAAPAPSRAVMALREASFEPRNLLAHIDERPHAVRTAEDGATEIVLPAEGLAYRFDGRTGLCDRRTDDRSGTLTHYLDWMMLGGIATPLREAREEFRTGATEEIAVLGVAYDLPLPDAVFRA